MDQVALRNADLLILTALTQTPTANPDSMLGEFCMAVGTSIGFSSHKGVTFLYPAHVTYFSFHVKSGRKRSRTMPSIWSALRPFRMFVGSLGQYRA